MKLWTRHDAQGDPPKDPEILGWFRTLGPPPTGQAPSYLQAKVRARIAQQRARRRMFAWMPSIERPAWATALAAVLVLSIGLNVWWGMQGFGLRSPGARHMADTSLGDPGAAERLRTYRFQAEMPRGQALGPVVAARTPIPEPSAVVGFTPQAARQAFFRMGTLYADALAALQGGAVEIASQRLDLLMQALAGVQASPVLAQYLGAIKTLLQSERHENAVVARFLALFEPLYEDTYARADMAEGILLFRAGAWLENMYLAAASGDTAAVRRGGQAVDEVRSALARLNAPREALEALARVRPLAARQPLTDRELSTIRTLIQDVQTLLNT
jgi:hypothetical protein